MDVLASRSPSLSKDSNSFQLLSLVGSSLQEGSLFELWRGITLAIKSQASSTDAMIDYKMQTIFFSCKAIHPWSLIYTWHHTLYLFKMHVYPMVIFLRRHINLCWTTVSDLGKKSDVSRKNIHSFLTQTILHTVLFIDYCFAFLSSSHLLPT